MKIAISGYVGTKLTGIGRVLIEVLNEMAPMNRNDEYILFKNFDFNDYDVLKKHSNIKIVNINFSAALKRLRDDVFAEIMFRIFIFGIFFKFFNQNL